MLIHVIVNRINLDSKEYPIHMQGVCVSEHEAEGRASRAERGRLIPRTSVTDFASAVSLVCAGGQEGAGVIERSLRTRAHKVWCGRRA